MKKYKTIVVDPPWEYGNWGKASALGESYFRRGKWDAGGGWQSTDKVRPLPYLSMTIKKIESLPIQNISADDCDLYLWTTSKYLPIAFKVLQSWGFDYKQILVWCKAPRGLGQGGLFAPTTEFILLGRKGKMPIYRRLDSTWYLWKRQKNHSQKPEELQDLIEKVSDEPRIELFARRKRKGWDSWGNEIDSDINIESLGNVVTAP